MTFIKTFCLFTIALLLCTEAMAETYRLAYSKKQGVEVFANSLSGDWCREALHLKVIAQDKTLFNKEDFNILMKKLGTVIAAECPVAIVADIDGYNAEKQLIYKATASEANKWAVQKKAFPSQKAKKKNSKQLVYNSFSVGNWQPPKLGSPVKIIGKNVHEHIILTKDKSCSIRYNRNKSKKEMKDWYLSVSDNECPDKYLNGKAAVQVFDDKGNVDGEGTGYFTDGYFTLDYRWNVLFMQRYAFNDEHQRINFLIDSDPSLKVHYVGYLRSDYSEKFKKYTKWHGCDPFVVSAVTENEKIFLNDETIEKLIHKAGKYTEIFCPKASEISFFGTKSPLKASNIDSLQTSADDTTFLYGTTLKKDTKSDEWIFYPNEAVNNVKLRENLRLENNRWKWGITASDYKMLEKADIPERLAYLHGVESLDNATAMTAASLIDEKPVDVSIFLKVSSVYNKAIIADWPIKITLTKAENKIIKKGWYIVSGSLSADSSKKNLNKSLSAILDVRQVTACEKEQCKEINNAVFLVRKRHSSPDWLPALPLNEMN